MLIPRWSCGYAVSLHRNTASPGRHRKVWAPLYQFLFGKAPTTSAFRLAPSAHTVNLTELTLPFSLACPALHSSKNPKCWTFVPDLGGNHILESIATKYLISHARLRTGYSAAFYI